MTKALHCNAYAFTLFLGGVPWWRARGKGKIGMLHLSQVERKIIGKLLVDASASKLLVSVYDGEEWAVKLSKDQYVIREAIGATDETTLRFRDPARRDDAGRAALVGSVFLVHGNGADVISDYSDNAETRALIAGADALAEGAAG